LAAGRSAGVAVTAIGHVDAAPGLRVIGEDGALLSRLPRGFDHFAT
jgi:thiamine-monophosphate kinase